MIGKYLENKRCLALGLLPATTITSAVKIGLNESILVQNEQILLTFAAELLDLMAIILYNIYNGECFFKKIKNIFNFFVAFCGQSE